MPALCQKQTLGGPCALPRSMWLAVNVQEHRVSKQTPVLGILKMGCLSVTLGSLQLKPTLR